MADVIIPVATFTEPTGGACNISIRYDDVTLAVNRIIIDNQTTRDVYCGAQHRVTNNWVYVTGKAGTNKFTNVPAGYYLSRDPTDNSLSYGQTAVFCQWPKEGS